MIPVDSAVASMVGQLQSISEEAWQLKGQVSVTSQENNSFYIKSVPATTKQLSEDWREVNKSFVTTRFLSFFVCGHIEKLASNVYVKSSADLLSFSFFVCSRK